VLHWGPLPGDGPDQPRGRRLHSTALRRPGTGPAAECSVGIGSTGHA
jgi:hypothetical protein